VAQAENCILSFHVQVQNADVMSGMRVWETMNSSGDGSFISNVSVHRWYVQQEFICLLTTNQLSYNHFLLLGFLFRFENFFKIFF
jgi:hypothetical protein